MEEVRWQEYGLLARGADAPIHAALSRAKERGEAVAVLGYGISNRPLVTVLLTLGLRVVVYDQKPIDALGAQAAAALAAGASFVHTDEAWLACAPTVVFRSPGIRPDTPAIRTACERGALLASEMEWFLEGTPATVIAITGSDGKSTTTTLTALMLQEQCRRDGRGQVFLGGNLGTPLLSRLPEMTAQDFAVIELSSFQLSVPMPYPDRAAITNITPNHLNWHVDMQEYIDAKRNICSAKCGTRLVTNACNALTRQIAQEHVQHGGEAVLFAVEEQDLAPWDGERICCRDGVVTQLGSDGHATQIMPCSELLLPGRHNIENFMTACALVAGSVQPQVMAEVGRTFGGVEHRLERVRVLDGVTFYNSSIDSSPTRTAAALSALPARSAVVICGGYDKNIPFAPLAEVLCARAGAVVLTGATREKILCALHEHPGFEAAQLRVDICPEFSEAVTHAAALAAAGYGESVLLSPACASFDAFVNFEARGRAFKEQVLRMQTLTES